MTFEYGWAPYVFYVWVSIFGALTASQFWLLANAVYNATEAKRLFTIIGLGGILGAWSGGEATALIISLFDLQTENLLIISACVLVINIALTSSAWSLKRHEIKSTPGRIQKRAQKSGSFKQLFDTIRSSKHLMYIVSIITLAMIVSSLVDFQFKAISAISFQDSITGEVDKVGLTSFLGHFYGRLSLVSIIIQLFISGRMLRALGVGGIIMFLPVGLLLGTVGMIGFVGLTSAVLLRGADGALKNSIDKTGRELLFLPVPIDVKNRTKVFIDMSIDRGARGLAGGFLILLVYLFEYDADPLQAIRLISFVVLFFLACWLVIGFFVRKEYVNTFRIAIENREIDQDDLRFDFDDPSTIRTLVNSLKSENMREVDYALDMLSAVKNDDIIIPVKNLLESDFVSIRRKAVKILIGQKDRSLTGEMELLLNDPDIDIRSDAMYYLSPYAKDEEESTIDRFLNHPDINIRMAVILAIAKYGDDRRKASIGCEHLDGLLEKDCDEAIYYQTQVIRIIGLLNDKLLISYLNRFMDSEDEELMIELIKAIGCLQAEEYIPWLIERLRDIRFRLTAAKVLAGFGNEIIPSLTTYMLNTTNDIAVSKFIPRVLSGIPSQKAISALMELFYKVDSYLKYFVIKALNRLRVNYPSLSFDRKSINDVIINEIEDYYKIFQTMSIIGKMDSQGWRLMVKALEEHLDNSLERIFRIMGLSYPSHDIYSAYSKITGNNAGLRASAIEFLDNLLKGNVKRVLFPILDAPSRDDVIAAGENYLSLRRMTQYEGLLFLMRCNDNWLRSLAIFNIDPAGDTRLLEEIRNLAADRDPLVKETADYKLKQIA